MRRLSRIVPVPAYSPQKFTQPQLFVCLVLKIFFKTDYRGIVAVLNDSPDLCECFDLTSVPHFTTLQKASQRLLRLKVAKSLLHSTVEQSAIDLAAMDSTGLEAGHISQYFVRRKRSKQLEIEEETYYKRFPKLAVVCNCKNHLILSAITTRGPSVDINQFYDTLKPAVEQYRIKHLLADAGYDSEANHQYARDVHHIKTTIPARHGRPTKKLPKTKYRREMRTDFDKESYGRRWQVETVFSMIKRNFGSALRAKHYWSQGREMMLLVLTHNIAIILLVKELFYRAGQKPFIHCIWLQERSEKDAVCVNLGVHLDFVFVSGKLHIPPVTEIEQIYCEVKDRLASSNWWLAKPAKEQVTSIRMAMEQEGVIFFERYKIFPGFLESITIDDINTGEVLKYLPGMTYIRLALFLARVNDYIGRREKAVQFSEYGLKNIGVENPQKGKPVLYSEAVIAGSGRAYSCLVAALKAFGRGWGR